MCWLGGHSSGLASGAAPPPAGPRRCRASLAPAAPPTERACRAGDRLFGISLGRYAPRRPNPAGPADPAARGAPGGSAIGSLGPRTASTRVFFAGAKVAMVEPNKRVDRLAREVIGAVIEVHLHLGLLINFNVPVLKQGIKRIVLS